MSAARTARILCVDDEPRILEGIAAHLRKDYEVHVAGSGPEAMSKLRELKDVAVIVSDMRMPGVDGATLLQQVLQSYPDVTRILLTGDPGRDVAVSAINRGQIFRFLTKPCPPDQLRSAIQAGVMQNRLYHAERLVLQETLLGCINALMDVLAITSPRAFGHASRVKKLAADVAKSLDCANFWQLEAAAMLSQIGYLSLTAELVEKLHEGARLTPEEQAAAAAVPEVAIRLLEHIPRLEPVMQILTALSWSDEAVARLGDGTIGTATRILGMVLQYDAETARGHPADVALESIRNRKARFGAEGVEKFAALLGSGNRSHIHEIPLHRVLVGMTMMQELCTPKGMLLVTRGFVITATFLEKVRHHAPELMDQPVKVMIPGTSNS